VVSGYETMLDYIRIRKHCLLLSWFVTVEFEQTFFDTSTNSNESKHTHRKSFLFKISSQYLVHEIFIRLVLCLYYSLDIVVVVKASNIVN
jgi:hypothetical protein